MNTNYNNEVIQEHRKHTPEQAIKDLTHLQIKLDEDPNMNEDQKIFQNDWIDRTIADLTLIVEGLKEDHDLLTEFLWMFVLDQHVPLRPCAICQEVIYAYLHNDDESEDEDSENETEMMKEVAV